MVGHGFQFHNGGAFLVADLFDNLFESQVDVAGDDITAVFGHHTTW